MCVCMWEMAGLEGDLRALSVDLVTEHSLMVDINQALASFPGPLKRPGDEASQAHAKLQLLNTLNSQGVEGASAAGNTLANAKAEDFVNNVAVEQMWAIQAFKYAETHFKLIQNYDAASLRLTGIDDEIHKQYLTKFEDLKIDVIDITDIKTPEAKELWRPFCNQFEGKVHDFNFGTLLRLDVTKDYTDENTILVPRIQFLAIEIARNKAGLNSVHYSQLQRL